MKKLLVLLFPLLSFAVLAKASPTPNDYRQEIMEVLDVYFQANVDKDYDTILDMIYPRLFEIVSKEEMKQLFTQMEAEGINYQVKGAEISSISNLVLHEGQQFALVKYILQIGLEFKGEQYASAEVQQMLMGTFKAQYGEDNVKLEEGAYWINAKNEMFAIAPASSKDWKFMEKKTGMEQLVNDFIPAEVQEKLK